MTTSHGEYHPLNPQKYLGTKKIIYRSGWERSCFIKLDQNPSVLKWASENIPIKYFFNLNQKIHTYWVDLYIEMIDSNKKINKFVVEIKPDAQLIPPKPPKNKNFKAQKNNLYRIKEYHKNQCKWSACVGFCRTYGYEFLIMTEKGIYIFENNSLKKISEKSFF